jgi:D-alanyl-D-alanine carboxypeptidase
MHAHPTEAFRIMTGPTGPRRATIRAASLLALLPALACASSPAHAPRADASAETRRTALRDALRDELQRALDSLRVAARVPGATLGVALPDGSTIALATGMSDTAARRPMRPTDRMLQGSVGKTYVSAVALQLVHEGRLDLDAPIARWLGGEPWFARLPNARDITVRQLMNHTSGLVRWEFDSAAMASLRADPMRPRTPAERLSYVLDRPAPFAAGEGWEYSDTNYIVLGLIIERITGRAYDDELRRRLLEPLGLRNTIPADRPDLPGLANGYAGPRNELGGYDASMRGGRLAVNPQFEWTGGGVASTADDLARWATLLYEGRAFDRSLLPRLLDAVPARLGPGARYGLGVIVRETPLGAAWGHSGFFPGYATEMMYLPATRTGLAVQVNATDPYPRGLAPFLLGVARIVARADSVRADSVRADSTRAGAPPDDDARRPSAALDTAALLRALEREMAARRAPGAAIAVVDGGRVVLARALGVRSVETRDPVTPETLFRIGSVTKLFTGLAALRLEGEGRLALDAPVGRADPALREPLARLTMHELLTHTAGLANEGAGDGLHDDRALAERVRGWGEEQVMGPPGDTYAYASTGYWLAGHVLSQAAAAPYADVVRDRVLAPLGMRRSTFRPTMALTWPLALDHRPAGDSIVVVRPFPDDATTWPSGSLFSSVTDLARAAIALVSDGVLDGERVIPADAVRRMLQPMAPVPGSDCGYSYGLSVCRRGGVTVASHYGYRGGSGAVFALLPERRAAVVILANGAGAILGETEALALRMLGAPAPAPDETLVARGAVPDSLLGAWTAGRDTLRLVARGGATYFRSGDEEQPAFAGSDGSVLVGPAGDPAQRFLLVRGRASGALYLHDGLGAFRRAARGR